MARRSLADRLSAFLGKTQNAREEDQSLREYCEYCSIVLLDASLYIHHRVCPACRFHYPLTARERIALVADSGTFRESHRSIVSLGLSASSQIQHVGYNRRTGLTEAAITGRCDIYGIPTVIIALDFRLLGATIGSIIGEKVSRAFELAARKKMPVVAIITSGGSRIQDGVLSLMQLAKISFAVNRLDQEKLPFIAVMANPTTGQVYSNFANLADIILAEPKAILGLAPHKTQTESYENTIPSGVNSAEAHLVHGMVDRVIDRENLKELLSVLLSLMTPSRPTGIISENVSYSARSPADKGFAGQYLEELWPSTWETVKLARHSQRPTSLDFVRRVLSDFVEIHGDRLSGDDSSVVAGLGYLESWPVMLIGQEKGHDITSIERHEGRVYPEGFRKAQRAMRLASKLRLPLITFVDTPGPYYGRESEERGLGNAIAQTTFLMAQLPIPTISVVIGQGGSEAALALGVADRILMLENSIYVVTSPENASALLYRDLPSDVREISEPLRLSAQDCYELGLVDLVVAEPSEGAHGNPGEAALRLKTVLVEEIAALMTNSTKRATRARYRKFRNMGEYSSHFRIALNREVSNLQSYVASRVRHMRRRHIERSITTPEQQNKEE